MTKYYFVRHGESTANAEGLFAGFTNATLTDRGIAQAQAAAEDIAASGIHFDVIFASPLSRAFETAKIITEAVHYSSIDIIVLQDLRERSAGELELAPVKAVYDVSEEQMAIYGGETAEQFRHRAATVFEDIRQQTKDAQNVLVVAHAGIYKMAIALRQAIEPATEAYQIPPPPNARLLELPL